LTGFFSFPPEVVREWEELYRLSGGTFRVHGFLTKCQRPGTVNPKPLNYAVMWRAYLAPRRLYLANKEPAQVPVLDVEQVGLFPLGGGDITDGIEVSSAVAILPRLFREARTIIQLAALRAVGRGAIA
jgi:hypothetical protein